MADNADRIRVSRDPDEKRVPLVCFGVGVKAEKRREKKKKPEYLLTA